MAASTDNTGTNPKQGLTDDQILQILIDRRDSFERAYEGWRDRIGTVDDGDNDHAIMAMLLMRDQWRRTTAALDSRLGRLPL